MLRHHADTFLRDKNGKDAWGYACIYHAKPVRDVMKKLQIESKTGRKDILATHPSKWYRNISLRQQIKE